MALTVTLEFSEEELDSGKSEEEDSPLSEFSEVSDSAGGAEGQGLEVASEKNPEVLDSVSEATS